MELSLNELNEALDQYCYITNISHQYSSNEVVYGLGTYNYKVPATQSITIEMKFSSRERLNALLQVTTDQHQEAQLREKSPTLQKAWEEYQILLKLSK